MRKLWDNLSNIGASKISDPLDLRQLKLLNRIVFFAVLVLINYIPLAFYFDLPVLAAYVSGGILLSMGCFMLNALGYFQAARIYYVFVGISFVSGALLLTGREAGSHIGFVLLGIFHLILFRDTRLALPFLFLIIIAGAAVSYYVETYGSPLDHLPREMKRLSFFINVLSMTILVFSVVLYFKKNVQEYETAIVEKNIEITQKNKDITDSIQYARRIQQAILPHSSSVEKALPDSFVFYQPKDIVAGDFYWVEKKDDTVFFTVADCTGHGVPGAFVSMVCSNALSKCVKELDIHRPSDVLDKTSELIEEYFSRSGDNLKDGMDLSFCSYSASEGKLQFAGANNGLYYIRNGSFNEVRPDKQPVGIHDHRRPFTNHEIYVQPGDVFYLFSDGLADQFGGPKGKKFLYSQFKQLLLAIHKLPMQEQKSRILEALQQWKGKLEQVDDVCVLGVRLGN